jgi:hypothetical protein
MATNRPTKLLVMESIKFGSATAAIYAGVVISNFLFLAILLKLLQ